MNITKKEIRNYRFVIEFGDGILFKEVNLAEIL